MVVVALTGGSASPLFPAIPVIPMIAALVAPGDVEDVGLVALVMTAAGAGLLVREGKDLAWILLWSMPLLAFLALGVRYARQHRRRSTQAIADAAGRAEELEVLADSERSLARQQRLARIALFAETVSHDLNSPLSAVLSNLSFARRELEAADGARVEAAEALADAAAAAARMKEIVSELRQLAQHELAHEGEEPARYAPAEALREAVRAAGLRVPGLAAVREELPAELPQPDAPRCVLVELALALVMAQVEAGAEEVVLRARSDGDRLLISAHRRGGGPLEGEPPAPFAICRAYARRLRGTFDSTHDDRTWELTIGLPTASRDRTRSAAPA
jgi:signal transduction histidine kinase